MGKSLTEEQEDHEKEKKKETEAINSAISSFKIQQKG